LQTLTAELESLEKSDSLSKAEELEESAKLVYCEHMRLSLELEDQTAEVKERNARLETLRKSASNQRIRELKELVKLAQSENALLREKSIAYPMKTEKTKIENDLKEIQDDETKAQEIIDRNNLEKEENIRNLEELTNSLKEEDEAHRRKIEELNIIIEEMKKKLAEKLKENGLENASRKSY
jgi:hypothetical protein